MHFPTRRFIIVSHRGSIPWGRAGGFSEVELLALCAGDDTESNRREDNGKREQGSCLFKADRGIMTGDTCERM